VVAQPLHARSDLVRVGPAQWWCQGAAASLPHRVVVAERDGGVGSGSGGRIMGGGAIGGGAAI
jgi:hypothetical protein